MDIGVTRIENPQGVHPPEQRGREAGSVGGSLALEHSDGEADLQERTSQHVGEDSSRGELCREVRAGWADAASLARERGDDALVGTWSPTRFDTAEWEWESDEGDV